MPRAVLCFFNNLNSFLFSSLRHGEISKLKESSVALEEKISQMTNEKEDLLVKIEAGDGANTALTQLKQENVSVLLLSLIHI